jgi:hypothetical protein
MIELSNLDEPQLQSGYLILESGEIQGDMIIPVGCNDDLQFNLSRFLEM